MAATPQFIDLATKAFRFASAPATPAESQAVKDKFPLAEDLEILTFIDNQADAQALADDRFAFMKDGKGFYTLRLQHSAFLFTEGKTVTFTYPRFGLQAGKPYFVAKLGEDSTTGITTIKLYG